MRFIIVPIFSFFFYLNTYSQLDSLDFTYDFENNPAFTAGLDSMSAYTNVLQVRAYFNEPQSVSNASVMIYDAVTGAPYAVIRRTHEEITSGSYSDQGLLVYNVQGLDPSIDYKIILEAQNLEGAYLPSIIKTYSPN